MSTQVVVARIAGLAGRSNELRQLLADRAVAARAEPGCAGYEVAELLDEPATFLVVETWRSPAEMRAHFSDERQAGWPGSMRFARWNVNSSCAEPASAATGSSRNASWSPASERHTTRPTNQFGH
jgi:quinol monooxygenase YgiN